MLTDWVVSLEGTEAGHQLALILALAAAVLHAFFGALQKSKLDPWIARGCMDAGYGILAAGAAIFLVPMPEASLWPVYLGVFVIHAVYKVLQAFAYTHGAYTVVYPVVRGTGPIFTVFGAYWFFGETFQPMQWMGVAVLLTGIFGLAVYNMIFLDVNRASLRPALILAVLTGGMVAVYTTYDAYGIRLAENPFTFLVWFFLINSLSITPYAAFRWYHMAERPKIGFLIRRGFLGGAVAICSFGSIMMATRLDKVGEAAILRETSTVFAALIGWAFLKETVGPRRVALMTLIALGAVIVEMGG